MRTSFALSALAGTPTLESRQTAVEGDWVIRGSKDEEWVTTAEHFAESYEVRDSAPQHS
jgi:hypothetical protein